MVSDIHFHFEDHDMPSRFQRSKSTIGLKQSWMSLQTHMSVSDSSCSRESGLSRLEIFEARFSIFNLLMESMMDCVSFAHVLYFLVTVIILGLLHY
jgi:hypothetical protein